MNYVEPMSWTIALRAVAACLLVLGIYASYIRR